MSFQEFGLLDEVVHGVQSMGYSDPTPIQLRAIPLVLEGRDEVIAWLRTCFLAADPQSKPGPKRRAKVG